MSRRTGEIMPLSWLGNASVSPWEVAGEQEVGHLCSDCPHFSLLTQINGRKWIGRICFKIIHQLLTHVNVLSVDAGIQ